MKLLVLLAFALGSCEPAPTVAGLPHSREETATTASPVNPNTINAIQDQLVHGTRTAIFYPAKDGFPFTSAEAFTPVGNAVQDVDLKWIVPIAGPGMEIFPGKRIIEVRVYAWNDAGADVVRAMFVRRFLDDAVNFDSLDATIEDINGGVAVGLQTLTFVATNIDIIANRTYDVVVRPVADNGGILRLRRIEVDYEYPEP